jgi:pimeloyl-ACP methyl ester carboxylesterase
MHGSGKPLLLIAGLASDVQSWVSIKKLLAKHFLLILFDNRGVGRSTLDCQSVTVNQMAIDAAALLTFLEIDKAHVLGHSMGGMIALQMAVRFPERIDRLILAASTTVLNQRQKYQLHDWATLLDAKTDMELWFRNLFYWLYSDQFFENQNLLTAYIIGALSYPYPIKMETFKAQVEAIIAFNGTPLLAEVRQKTLVLLADNDRLFSDSAATCTLTDISGCSVVSVKNAGHSLHIEQSSVFTRIVTDFLQSQ